MERKHIHTLVSPKPTSSVCRIELRKSYCPINRSCSETQAAVSLLRVSTPDSRVIFVGMNLDAHNCPLPALAETYEPGHRRYDESREDRYASRQMQ